MNKLYAIKQKSTPSQVVKGRDIYKGHHTALSLNQLIKLLKNDGIGCVERIRHDDTTPRNTRQLNGTEMLELWKVFQRTLK
jgi:hypothetical protein